MKVFKKIGLIVSMFSLIFCGALKLNSVSAVSDKVIEIHDKTQELADLVMDYYIKEYPEGLSGLRNLVEKLNENQLKILKNSFANWCFPQFVYNGSEATLSFSAKSTNLLVTAIQSGDLEFVKLIVENFDIPDINATDDRGCGSPLWCAVCLAGEESVDDKTVNDIVDYLLSIGADPYTGCVKGYIPDLFEMDSVSEPRMVLKETFEKYGYNDICGHQQ